MFEGRTKHNQRACVSGKMAGFQNKGSFKPQLLWAAVWPWPTNLCSPHHSTLNCNAKFGGTVFRGQRTEGGMPSFKQTVRQRSPEAGSSNRKHASVIQSNTPSNTMKAKSPQFKEESMRNTSIRRTQKISSAHCANPKLQN